MATSDGIRTEDWEKVQELALTVANTSRRVEDGEETKAILDAYKFDLLGILDELRRKYGDLPSILSTQADYIEDNTEKLNLFSRAYQRAKELGDHKNEFYTASSLARLYIEEFKHPGEGSKWLKVFRHYLLELGDDSDKKEFAELEEAFKTLVGPKGNKSNDGT